MADRREFHLQLGILVAVQKLRGAAMAVTPVRSVKQRARLYHILSDRRCS